MISRYIYYQIAFIFFIPAFAFCQNNIIKYVYDEEAGFYKKIEFFDTKTGIASHTIDIISNSPYENLNWQVSGKNTEGGSDYILKDDDQLKVFKQQQYPYYTLDHKMTSASSLISLYAGQAYTAIAYGLVGYNPSGEFLNWQSSFEVYNNLGARIFQIKDIPSEVKFPLVSEDGRYLSYAYGGAINDSGDTLFREGITVLDMHTGLPIFQYKVNEGETLKIPFIEHQKLFIIAKTGTNPDSQWIYRVLDFVQNKVYMKTFSWQEINNIKEISSDGVILGKENGKEKVLIPFSKGFEEYKIN